MSEEKTTERDKAWDGHFVSQTEAQYATLSNVAGKACANCRWFSAAYNKCFLVEDYPEPILATGLSNRWEATPTPPPELTEQIGEALAEVVEEAAEQISNAIVDSMPAIEMSVEDKEVFITPSDGMFSQLQKRLRSAVRPGVTVLKDNAGRRWMHMVTSNGYKDRDEEHVATSALQDYVKSSWTADDTAFTGDNDHYIWHVKELGSISDLMFADVWDGFLVEVWREQAGNPIAKAFYNYVENHPEIPWGASHGFRGELKDDTFVHIRKFESTSLPLDAAANLLTLSEVLPMAEKSKRDEFLNSLFKEQFGIDDVTALLKQGTAALRAELAKRGVEAKALGEGSDALKEAKSDALKGVAELMVEMVDVQDAFDRRVEGVEKSVADTISGLSKQVTALLDEVTELRKVVNAGPRSPSQDSATKADDEETNKAKEKLEAAAPDKSDPFAAFYKQENNSNGHA